MVGRENTVLFEERYRVNIEDFSTTCEIDNLVAKEFGKESLEVEMISPNIVSARGAIIPIEVIDIDSKFDKAIKK